MRKTRLIDAAAKIRDEILEAYKWPPNLTKHEHKHKYLCVDLDNLRELFDALEEYEKENPIQF